MLFVVGVVGEAVGYGGKGYAVVAVQPFALLNAVSADFVPQRLNAASGVET